MRGNKRKWWTIVFAVADVAGSILLWSQFMARFGGNLPGSSFSTRWDFLWSLHLFSPSTFSPHISVESFLHVLSMYISSTPPIRPWKAKEEASLPRPMTSTCLSSTSLAFSSSPMAVAITEAPFHVLAVDDSVLDRKLIERLLKTSSFQVTTVDSGTKALEFLGLHGENASISVHADADQLAVEANVNLIITDYCMPGMTGYDLLRKIKESSSFRDIPVVIMSSENIPSRINRCLEEGANEFFLKPVRLSDMSKLKPHIMKSRCKEHYHQDEDLLSKSDSNPTNNSSSDAISTSNPTNNSSGDTISSSNPTNNSSNSTNNCSNPMDNSNGDSSNIRKRKAADDKVLPKTSRPNHSLQQKRNTPSVAN